MSVSKNNSFTEIISHNFLQNFKHPCRWMDCDQLIDAVNEFPLNFVYYYHSHKCCKTIPKFTQPEKWSQALKLSHNYIIINFMYRKKPCRLVKARNYKNDFLTLGSDNKLATSSVFLEVFWDCLFLGNYYRGCISAAFLQR